MTRKKVKTSNNVTESSDEGVSRPAASRRTLRGKRGGLKDMPNMPLDIIVEICCYLEPRDLLALARTSKPFRALLMTRESAHLWKTARKNLEGFPDCPQHLSEPAYANLAFSPHCHLCLKNNVKSVLWDFSVRYCSNCKKEQTTGYIDHLPHPLYTHIKNSSDVLNYIPDSRRGLYHNPQILALQNDWDKVKGNKLRAERFIQDQKGLVERIHDHAHLCKIWAYSQAMSREAELDNIREIRLHAIESRLRELGWHEDLEYLKRDDYCLLADHAQVRQPKKLTDKGWEKIREQVLCLMQGTRDRRLREERYQILCKRLQDLFRMMIGLYAEARRTAADEFKPFFMDFALMPEFRAIADAPSNTNVTNTEFSALRDQIPTLTERWRADIKKKLTNLVRKEIKVNKKVDPLDLAVAFFRCYDCSTVLPYPEILAHKCCRPDVSGCITSYCVPDLYTRVALSIAGARRWTFGRLEVGRTLKWVEGIVRACGKDPSSTTREEMDNLDLRLSWTTYPNGIKRIKSWRTAAHDSWTSYRQIKEPVWEVVSEEERDKAKELETNYHKRYPKEPKDDYFWCCSLCTARDGRFLSIVSVKEHLRKAHSIENASEEDRDMYHHPLAEQTCPTEVLLLPDTLQEDDLKDYEQEKLWLTEGRACFFKFPPKDVATVVD
ncbi:hypothetical protein AcV7_002185 [Taiwanofungus camphoratus]|nr:hypothetical protein AcV7_002185 [Antrodia cinnamomea]